MQDELICRPATEYILTHTSRFHERIIQVQAESQLRTCCKCGREFRKSQMAHVGNETYKCKQCLGIT